MKYTAIVLAAGKGTRMQSNVSKQFMELGGKPVVYYSLKAFEVSPVDNIILVTGEKDIEFCRKEVVEKYGFTKVTAITAGGAERYLSVWNGIQAAGECDYIRSMTVPVHLSIRKPYSGAWKMSENPEPVLQPYR